MNMDAKNLKEHATALKEFLLTSWIKHERWKQMYQSSDLLASSLEKYVFHLIEKKQKYLEPKNSGIVIADSIHIKVLKISDSSSSQLSSLIDELSTKGNYKYLFVGDFTPPKRIDRFYYIRQLENGLPFPAVLCTYSFGEASAIIILYGKYPLILMPMCCWVKTRKWSSRLKKKFLCFTRNLSIKNL